MIIVYLKTSDKIFQIKNTEKYSAGNIVENLSENGFVRIYNYIFPCNDIEHIEVSD